MKTQDLLMQNFVPIISLHKFYILLSQIGIHEGEELGFAVIEWSEKPVLHLRIIVVNQGNWEPLI